MSPWKNGHDLHNEVELLANDPTIETDIARPIHQFSARCQQSLAICATKDNNKTAIPPCLYFPFFRFILRVFNLIKKNCFFHYSLSSW